jgi:hypothetical protein
VTPEAVRDQAQEAIARLQDIQSTKGRLGSVNHDELMYQLGRRDAAKAILKEEGDAGA